jgi:predicted dithiol-disulfide oxidoreductase (DUF899 family)
MASPRKVKVKTSGGVAVHRVASAKEALKARMAFLAKEKKFTKEKDRLARARRGLPWVEVEKDYIFEGPGGPVKLADLFGKKSQLVVYHFMFAPEWEQGCPHCSFWGDHYSGPAMHLPQRDVSFTAISRAPIEKIEAFKKRMGWTFPWVSSGGSDFNYDFHASFTEEDNQKGTSFYNYRKGDTGSSDREGASVFYKDEGGKIYHTYSTFARGIDNLNTTYHFLELVPKGRDEEGLEFTQSWVRHHDRYEA